MPEQILGELSLRQKMYGWKGWKMPIRHLNDPDYCAVGCPICTNARRGNIVAKVAQSIEMLITLGGCPWGRARRRKTGKMPHEG